VVRWRGGAVARWRGGAVAARRRRGVITAGNVTGGGGRGGRTSRFR
jgi:hypothetical protein